MTVVHSGGQSIAMNTVTLPSLLSRLPQMEGEQDKKKLVFFFILLSHIIISMLPGHMWLAIVWGSWQDLIPALVCILQFIARIATLLYYVHVCIGL